MSPLCVGALRPWTGLLVACVTLCLAPPARAQQSTAGSLSPVAAAGSAFPPSVQRAPGQRRDDPRYDPYSHDLRIGVFPVHFMGAWSQMHVGSSARAELDVIPRLAVAAWGRFTWGAEIADGDGDDEGLQFTGPATAFGFGAGLRYFFIDSTERRSASGAVYPRDPGIPPGADPMHTATGDDLDVPVSQRMGGPEMVPYEVDHQAIVPMRVVHALRVGYDFTRGPQEGRDSDDPDARPLIDNRVHMLHLGWGMGSHWNLPASATGQRELGFKRGYVDVLLSMPALADKRAIEMQSDGFEPSFMPVGIRLGIEGASNALFEAWEGLGLAYKLEGGALPGYSGFEAYVYLALGVELDAASGTNTRLQNSR